MRIEFASLACGLAMAAGHAHAVDEPSPFMLGVSQGLIVDSNLFRAPPGGPVQRDRISATGVRMSTDMHLGRQRLSARLQADANRYRDNPQLDNTEYAASARLDWETVERISGEFSAEQRQSLYRDTFNGTVSTQKNLLRTSGLAFQARIGLVTVWSFEGGMAASRNDYSSGALGSWDLQQQSANAGVRWRPSQAMSTRLGLRRAQGRYPRAGQQADDFHRDDLDLHATLETSGLSSLNLRLSATREEHSAQEQRDTRGWTGALGAAWKPTGKLAFDAELYRDSGVGQTRFDSALITAASRDTRISQGFKLNGTWSATAKIQVSAQASQVRRKLDNGFSAGSGPSAQATDRTSTAGLGVRWQPLRALDLACDARREHRSTEGSPLLTLPYAASVASCSVQLALHF